MVIDYLANGIVKTRLQQTILVVEEEAVTRELIVSVLSSNGFDVTATSGVADAATQLAANAFSLIICDDVSAAEVAVADIPLIVLRRRGESGNELAFARASGLGSIVKPIRPPELVARVRGLLTQGDAPPNDPDRRAPERRAAHLEVAVQLDAKYRSKRPLLHDAAFDVEVAYDLERNNRSVPLSLAYLELFELAGIRKAFGQRGQNLIAGELLHITERFPSIVRLGVDGNGRFLLLMKGPRARVARKLNELARVIVAHRFHLSDDPVRLTPFIGFISRTEHSTVGEMRRCALLALAEAADHHDLQAVAFQPSFDKPESHRIESELKRAMASVAPLRLPLQIAATFTGAFFIPFAGYWFLALQGIDFTNSLYMICVAMLLFTALGIVWESVLALKNEDPPSAGVYPIASAIIAAYLPNEAATIVETIEAFLQAEYAGELQVILAYNTPYALPIEEELHAISQRDPRFFALRIEGSTSKAQNVNAALAMVSGAFVGVFDADHKPDADSFTRAWDWLAHGYDIVQGHCLIRNGAESLVSRIVAVEFETIYAVSHPGRARFHGFGLFGGSNGYWKTDLLRQTRMHHFMLTEDIDSSLRVIEAGYHIKSDRKLISRELAPITLQAFWNQRLRWAQGWFQVSIKHVIPALRSPHLSLRQKAGMMHLLIWRECYVWMSIQILPIIAFWIFVRHDQLNWGIPIFVATTIAIMLTSPIQLLFTYLLADPQIRQQRGWFGINLIASLLVFSELKNAITRLAHLKEAMRERTWRVTPRSVSASGSPE